MVVPMLKRVGFPLSISFDWRDPRVKRVLVLMLPVSLGLGVINVDLVINSIIGTLISDGRAARDRRRLPHLHAPAGRVLASRSRPCCSRS